MKEAIGGEEALQMLDQCDPDLLITDLRTPSMSGIDLIRRIRGEEKWENLPIIAISAYSHEHSALTVAMRWSKYVSYKFIRPIRVDAA